MKGQRVYAPQPTAKGQRLSMIGALSASGMKTALTFEGTLTGHVFLYFLEHFLCPILTPNQYVIMDNASAHKVQGVAELIEKTGAKLLYLPPYSPELNPIELAWNKVKAFLRRQQARTKDALYRAYAHALKSISQLNAQAFVDHTMKVAI